MNLNLMTFALPRFISSVSQVFRKRSLLVQLPIMAIEWFQDVERITDGLISLRINPTDTIDAIRTLNHTTDSWKAVKMNAKWNIIWSKYCLAILKNKLYPTIQYSFNNVIRYNAKLLKQLGEEEPSIDLQLIKLSGKMGFDLIAGDLVGNSYVDTFWGELVNGLDNLTSFRSNYIEASGIDDAVDGDTAIIAKAIALAEISWSNEFFPFRNVSDMVMFESIWWARFRTGMMTNFIQAANLVGADLPSMTSREVIRRVGANPDRPIEEVIA